MQGQSVSIPTGNNALSAIDTGTTLIGGPSDAVNTIWAAVNGSQALKGQMQGFFAFRECLASILAPATFLALCLRSGPARASCFCVLTRTILVRPQRAAPRSRLRSRSVASRGP